MKFPERKSVAEISKLLTAAKAIAILSEFEGARPLPNP